MNNLLPNRSDVNIKDTWATDDLYKNNQLFLEDLELFKKRIDELGSYKGKLNDAHSLYDYFSLKNNIMLLADRVSHYASLKSDEDTGNSLYQNYRAKVSDAFVLMSSATAFEVPELISVGMDRIEEMCKELPELSFYKHAIDDELRLSGHTLDEQGEQLLAMSGEMADASSNTFSLLSNADMAFEPFKVDDKEYHISQGSFVPLMQNRNREVRKTAFTNYYKEYKQFSNTFASLINGQMKMLSFYAKAGKYNSTLEASLMANNVSTDIYYNLIEAVHQNIGLMHDYVKLRKKALGLSELHMYDIYVPLVKESDRNIPYDTARKDILETLSVYGNDYLNVIKEAFDNRWIDKYENKGKRSGAYSAGSFVHPYILLNYKDNLDSEFTLVHELGHAMHSYFSNNANEPIYSQYVIFVAEVASTCNESLLMRYLLNKTTDKKERAVLINYFLEQFKGTLYRQTMFAEFELFMNEQIASGESLTADILNEKYYELNKFYFGEGIVLDEEIALEWARIPHFYYNYYVYQYATGFSAAIALSDILLNGGEPAVRKYLNFLSSGCTKDPVSLLKDAGVDMSSAAPINTALNLFRTLLKEFEELL